MGFTPSLAIDLILQTLWFVVLGRVLVSWIDPAGSGRIARILIEMSEPILGPARRILPPIAGIDFAPLVVMVVLQALRSFV
ncbi:MAG: YggT family protein [Candidatus Limnocylindrus sp.]